MHPKTRLWRLHAFPFYPAAINEINIPRQFAIFAQRQSLDKPCPEALILIPKMQGARIKRQAPRTDCVIVIVIGQYGQPDDISCQLRRGIFFEHFALHHPGAMATDASSGRKQNQEPHFRRVRIEALHQRGEIIDENFYREAIGLPGREFRSRLILATRQRRERTE